MTNRFVEWIDWLTDRVSSLDSWLVVPLFSVMGYEVFARFVLGWPTFWSWELSYMITGSHFVLGSILFAIAVPTEAAAIGAIGSIVLAIGYRKFSIGVMREALMTTLSITAMILTIVVGGLMFSGVFAAAGGLTALQSVLVDSQLGSWGSLLLILFVTFIAGFVIDLITIMLIFVPLAMPIIKSFGFDPLWFSITLLIMMQTSMLTPPMAGAIFYFRAIAPPEITLRDMYRGVIPFVALHFMVLALLFAFPWLALWLPTVLLGR